MPSWVTQYAVLIACLVIIVAGLVVFLRWIARKLRAGRRRRLTRLHTRLTERVSAWSVKYPRSSNTPAYRSRLTEAAAFIGKGDLGNASRTLRRLDESLRFSEANMATIRR